MSRGIEKGVESIPSLSEMKLSGTWSQPVIGLSMLPSSFSYCDSVCRAKRWVITKIPSVFSLPLLSASHALPIPAGKRRQQTKSSSRERHDSRVSSALATGNHAAGLGFYAFLSLEGEARTRLEELTEVSAKWNSVPSTFPAHKIIQIRGSPSSHRLIVLEV